MQRKRLDGVYIPGETRVGATATFNRFVKLNTGTGLYELCGAGEDADGVIENDLVSKNLDDTARTAYKANELANIKVAGFAYVEAGEKLDAKDYVKSGANGVASKYTFPTIGGTYSQSEAQAASDQPKLLKGKVIKGAAQGAYAFIVLYNMG